MKRADIHILVVLGRIGRHWGNIEDVLEERIRIAQSVIRPHQHFDRYDRVVITGGYEFSEEMSNARFLFEQLAAELNQDHSDRVVLHEANCRNQVALINAIDEARLCWPDANIRFDFVTSAYARERMAAYFMHHSRQLEAQHDPEIGSRRHLFYHFYDDVVPRPVSSINLLRERIKIWLDLRRPDPIPLVMVN